jgi:hypothetical protein
MYINRARVKEYVLSSTGNFDVTVPGLRKYFIDHNKELLKNPAMLSAEFIKIAEVWDYIKEYPVVKLLLKFNENAKLYLSAYLSRYDAEDISPEKTLDICHYLIRLFTILELVVADIHDALILCCPKNEIGDIVKVVTPIMVRPFAGLVDNDYVFPTRISIGKTWKQWKLWRVCRE